MAADCSEDHSKDISGKRRSNRNSGGGGSGSGGDGGLRRWFSFGNSRRGFSSSRQGLGGGTVDFRQDEEDRATSDGNIADDDEDDSGRGSLASSPGISIGVEGSRAEDRGDLRVRPKLERSRSMEYGRRMMFHSR